MTDKPLISPQNVPLWTVAGFIVALTGAVMTMPGLPAAPAAMRMDVDDAGNPVGLS